MSTHSGWRTRQSRSCPAWISPPGLTTGESRVPPFASARVTAYASTLLNTGDHPHSIHFHGVHPGLLDGVFDAKSGVVPPGGRHVYEFDAEPFGFHLYHCHTAPLAKHIAKGLYGAFIIDPKAGRPRADHELIMVMSGFDVDFDGANDFYQVNGIPFHYEKHPIQLKVGELVRVYLANTLEYDQINSFHLHANFFQYYPTGTSLTPASSPTPSPRCRGSGEFSSSASSTRVATCSTRTRRSSPSWVGRESSKWRPEDAFVRSSPPRPGAGNARDACQRKGAASPHSRGGFHSADSARRGDRALRAYQRSRAERHASGSDRDSAVRSNDPPTWRDRDSPPQHQPRSDHAGPGQHQRCDLAVHRFAIADDPAARERGAHARLSLGAGRSL